MPKDVPGGWIGRRSRPLHFEPPDFERFPALKLAYQVAEAGGTAGAVLNAANEVAVAAFMDGKIPFGEICALVELTISRPSYSDGPGSGRFAPSRPLGPADRRRACHRVARCATRIRLQPWTIVTGNG